MNLEFIVQNGEEAKQAEAYGADRVELVSAIAEGGLTPSYGTIRQVLGSVSIPVQVMMRPHSFHYHYSDKDMDIILEDIQALRDLGGSRIVFGALNADDSINETFLNNIIERYPQLDITFHKAFDEVPSQRVAYHLLAAYKANVKRILTSGGKHLSINNLQDLMQLEKETGGPSIMPGGGLSAANIAEIHEGVLAQDYHFGKAVRINASFANSFDRDTIKNIADVVQSRET